MRHLLMTFALLLLPVPSQAEPDTGFIGPLAETLRCTPDGSRCIGTTDFLNDTCTLIEVAAKEVDIDPGFLARLLWRESLFDPAAISPAGAQGIAQFMPSTARLRGLKDPFNPAEAIVSSAVYLADLTRRYGNHGLAAAGYNGGENRVESFIASAGGLPGETRAYVRAITGYSAEDWRDEPPEKVDYRLDGKTPFLEACKALASDHAIREFRDPVPPWGVIVAAGRNQSVAESTGRVAAARHAGIIDASDLRFVQRRMPSFGRRAQFTAQVPAESLSEAMGICGKLRAQNGYCQVVRN
jgi:Transglycosylase SLT domain